MSTEEEQEGTGTSFKPQHMYIYNLTRWCATGGGRHACADSARRLLHRASGASPDACVLALTAEAAGARARQLQLPGCCTCVPRHALICMAPLHLSMQGTWFSCYVTWLRHARCLRASCAFQACIRIVIVRKCFVHVHGDHVSVYHRLWQCLHVCFKANTLLVVFHKSCSIIYFSFVNSKHLSMYIPWPSEMTAHWQCFHLLPSQ